MNFSPKSAFAGPFWPGCSWQARSCSAWFPRRASASAKWPDVDAPNVTVSLGWPGAGPEEIESGIIQPLEESLAQVEGVQRNRSDRALGSARLTAIFRPEPQHRSGIARRARPRLSQAQRSLPRTCSSRPSRRAIPMISRCSQWSKRRVFSAIVGRRRAATKSNRSCRRSRASARSRPVATWIEISDSGSTATS